MNTRAASEWQSEIKRSRTALLNYLLLTTAIGGLVALILNYIAIQEGRSLQEQWAEMYPFLAGWLVILVPWLWRGLGYRPRAWIALTLAYALGVFIFRRGGLPGSGSVWMLLPPVMAFVLLGSWPGIWAGVLSTLTYIFFAIAFSQGWIDVQVQLDPLVLATWLTEGASFFLIVAVLTLLLWAFSRSWLDALGGVDAANRQLQAQTQELEIANVQLHRQTSQLQATAEIGHAGSSILDPDALQSTVVNQIQEGFSSMGVYYVGLFLLDDADAGTEEQSAVLKAATGEAGKLLLDMGYRLKLDETTPVGWCITHQQARIVLGEGGTVWLDTLPMPNTRSEIALPLRSRGRTLGALSMQSTHEAAFIEDDIAILQTVADQVAVTIDNARLFRQTEAALEEAQAAHRRYLAEAWSEFLATKPVTRIDYTQPGTEPGDERFLSEARHVAMVHKRTIATDSPSPGPDGEPSTPQTALVVPLKLRGQVIGTMALHETGRQRTWTAGETALAENVAEQVALTVENLRLMDETRRRAAHERLTSEITDKMRSATDMDALMQTTVQEMIAALGTSSAFVQLAVPSEPAGDGREKGIQPPTERAGR